MNGVLPDDTFEFTLPADGDKPAGERRVLIYRHGRARKWLEWSRRARQINAMDDWDQRLLAYVDLLRTDLVGAQNLDVETLLDSLDQSELAIIAGGLPSAAMLSEFDRKKSPSPSRSATAPCAASAAVGVAEAGA